MAKSALQLLLEKKKQERMELSRNGVGATSVLQKSAPVQLFSDLSSEEKAAEKAESSPSVEGLSVVSSVAAAISEVALDPMCPATPIRNRIKLLRHQLDSNIPGFDKILREIHAAISKDPDTVHLLSEEEIGTIVSGLCKRKDIILVDATAKKSKGKAKEKFELDDL